MLRDLKTNLPINEKDYNDKDEGLMSLNTKAINMLFCALDSTEFNYVSSCEST